MAATGACSAAGSSPPRTKSEQERALSRGRRRPHRPKGARPSLAGATAWTRPGCGGPGLSLRHGHLVAVIPLGRPVPSDARADPVHRDPPLDAQLGHRRPGQRLAQDDLPRGSRQPIVGRPVPGRGQALGDLGGQSFRLHPADAPRRRGHPVGADGGPELQAATGSGAPGRNASPQINLRAELWARNRRPA